jgi:hypothetical protein
LIPRPYWNYDRDREETQQFTAVYAELSQESMHRRPVLQLGGTFETDV